MQVIFSAINDLFGLLLIGHGLLGRYLFIVCIGLISALIFLLIFKWTSNQIKIRRYKKRALGHVLQMRIYQDRLGMILASIVQIAKYNLLYVKQNLVPLLFVFPPLVVMTAVVNNHSGYQSLAEGQSFILDAQIDPVAADGQRLLDQLVCRACDGVALQSGPVRIPGESRAYWRAKVVADSTQPARVVQLGFPHTNEWQAKALAVGPSLTRFDPSLIKWSWQKGFFVHAEGFLPPEAKLSSINIRYQRADYPFFFWDVDALVLYFIWVLVFALLFKGFFKVTL